MSLLRPRAGYVPVFGRYNSCSWDRGRVVSRDINSILQEPFCMTGIGMARPMKACAVAAGVAVRVVLGEINLKSGAQGHVARLLSCGVSAGSHIPLVCVNGGGNRV